MIPWINPRISTGVGKESGEGEWGRRVGKERVNEEGGRGEGL